MKRIFISLLAVIMILSLAACGGQQKEQGQEKAYTVDGVNMTYVKSPLNVPSIVEKAQGSFEKAYSEMGLDFAYSELTSGADQTAALASGDIQILNAVGGTSVILSAANGADIKIIGMYSTSPKAFRIYSKDENINSPADLKGKTIAGPKGTNLHELLAAYLASGNLTIEDVDFVSMDIPSAFAALESGSVDCALQAGANAYNCSKAGYHLVTDGENLISGTILTATTQEFYENNKAIIDKFLEVQKETLSYIDENKDEAMKMASEATELDIEAVEEMYPLYDFKMDISDDDIASLQKTADFMLSSGLIEKEIDVKTLILEK